MNGCQIDVREQSFSIMGGGGWSGEDGNGDGGGGEKGRNFQEIYTVFIYSFL